MAENINISIGNVVRQGSVARVRMRWPTSTVNKTQVNEWPVLLNAIERTAFADATVDQGFTYTFPFALARGTGFPTACPCSWRPTPSRRKPQRKRWPCWDRQTTTTTLKNERYGT